MHGAPRIFDGDRVQVRMATEDDAARLLKFHVENAEFFALTSSRKQASFYSESSCQERIRVMLQEQAKDQAYRMFVFRPSVSDDVIGSVSLSSVIRGVFHACILGYALAQSAQGQGFMDEALRLTIDFAFGELNLHRIMANYWPENVRSAKVLRRLGFEIEGYARSYLFVNGVWQDHYNTALTNDAWRVPAELSVFAETQ